MMFFWFIFKDSLCTIDNCTMYIVHIYRPGKKTTVFSFWSTLKNTINQPHLKMWRKPGGPRISPPLTPPQSWERCMVRVENLAQAHKVLLEQILTSCMRTWALWISWRKGSKSVVHTAAVVLTWLVGGETQALENAHSCLISPQQSINCYLEKKICCMSSGWSRRQWRRPWRGSSISSSKTSSPPTFGGGRSPLKSVFGLAISMRKNPSKYIFMCKQLFLFILSVAFDSEYTPPRTCPIRLPIYTLFLFCHL